MAILYFPMHGIEGRSSPSELLHYIFMLLNKYFTKSHFKLGIECPTKLCYFQNPDYFDSSLDDDFLGSLADGGYQIGELAKLKYKEGVDLGAFDVESAIKKTCCRSSM